MIRTRTLLFLLVANGSLLLPACKGGGCPDGAQAIAEGGFCIQAPKDWDYKGAEKSVLGLDFRWLPKHGGSFDVYLKTDETMPNDIKSSVSISPGYKVTSGELAGGKGKWVMSTDGKGGVCSVLVQTPKGIVSCGISQQMPDLQKTLDLCKTITPL